MKKLFILFCLIFFAELCAISDPVSFMPYKVILPDGDTLHCYISGDEYYRWIHDENGYTIVKGKDNYFYYATKENNQIISSQFKALSIDPGSAGIEKWLKISEEEYLKKRKILKTPDKPVLKTNTNNRISQSERSSSLHEGTMNNIVIYIRFADEAEFERSRGYYDSIFNSESISLKAYFEEVSYQKLTINSSHYPAHEIQDLTNLSYQDSHERAYFQPYDELTNPEGYQYSDRINREHQLLADAITWLNNNNQFPDNLDFDMDGDGFVDNVTFVIKGFRDAWADLLWGHRASLYSKEVSVNNKSVWNYTIQLENSSLRTFCHEMFHVLGAPDLYHYNDGGLNLRPVGWWDIMQYGFGHMGAYMKWKYSNQVWINAIPEINTPGSYALNPLTSSINNSYKIQTPFSETEFFIVEYRRKTGDFESNLPGEGLLVYRINSDFWGNARFNGSTVFDEIYLYRPGGTTTEDGIVGQANFSLDQGRTDINDGTNPNSFLHDGSPGGLNISNISSSGNVISFDFDFPDAPNLTFDSTYNSIFASDSMLLLNLRILNTGVLSSAQFEIALYLSEDINIETSDLLLEKESLSLDIGDFKDITFSVGLDSLLNIIATGKYNVGYIIDNRKDINERNEKDNSYLYSDFTLLKENICENDSFSIGDKVFSDSGLYYVTLKNNDLKDSLIYLSLTSYPDSICGPDLIITNGTIDQYIKGDTYEIISYEINIKNIGNVIADLVGTIDDNSDNVVIKSWISSDTILLNGNDIFSSRSSLNDNYLDAGDSLMFINYLGKENIHQYPYIIYFIDSWYNLEETNELNNTYYMLRDSLILLSSDSLIFNANSGKTISFSISSNVEWEITSEANWISIDPINGSQSGKVIVTTISENNTSVSIVDTIKISGQGANEKLITVIQKCQIETSMDTVACGEFQIGDSIFNESGNYEVILTNLMGCDSIISIELIINPVYDETAEAEICEGNTYIFGSQTLTEPGIYIETFKSIDDCDSVVTLILEVNPIYDVSTRAEICDGETYIFGTQTLTNTGVYIETFKSIDECDSVVTLTLEVNPIYDVPSEAEICEGDTLIFGDQILTDPGIYTETFKSINDCDSIVTLILEVNPIYDVPSEAEICEGDTLIFGDQILTDPGIYTETFQSINDCDSIVTLSLEIYPGNYQIEAVICEGKKYIFGSDTLDLPNSYTKTFQSVNGCDSIVTLNLVVFPDSICGPDLIISNVIIDKYYTHSSGDEYVDYKVSIKNVGTKLAENLNNLALQTWRSSDTVFLDGNDEPAGGRILQLDKIIPSDSVVVIQRNGKSDLSLFPFIFFKIDYGDIVDEINETNNLIHVLRDSLILTSTDSLIFTANQGETASYAITSNVEWDVSYDANWISIGPMHGSQSGRVFITTIDENKSSVNIVDTIKVSGQGADDKLITLIQKCQIETFIDTVACGEFQIGDSIFNESGNYEVILTSLMGCDSIINVELIINPVYDETATEEICEGDTFIFGDQILTEPGVYIDTLKTVNDCDSIVTLTLTVNPIYNVPIEDEICEGDILIFGDQILTEPGVYIDTLKTVNDCDSIVTLTLIVNPIYNVPIEDEICNGDTYIFGDQILTEPGTYTETFKSINGCDSLVTLTLVVKSQFITPSNHNVSALGGDKTLSVKSEVAWSITGVELSVIDEVDWLRATKTNNDFISVSFDANRDRARTATITLSGSDCPVSASVTVNQGIITGMADSEELSTLKLYPNPFNKELTVIIEKPNKIMRIQIYNVLGEEVIEFSNINSNETTLDLSKLSHGFYKFVIQDKEGIILKKVIKM